MPANVRIRLALPFESRTLASIGAEAFLNDPFEEYLHPNRKSNPEAYRRLYRQKIDAAIHEHLSWVMVAEASDAKTLSTETLFKPPIKSIVGYAIWTRETSDKREKATRRRLEGAGLYDTASALPITARIKHCCLNCSLVEAFQERTNPVLDRKRAHAFWDECKEQVERFDEPEEYWYLQELAVAPDHHRQGVGRALLDWGIHWARREEIPILLDSTPAGKELYRKVGFVKHGLWRWGKGPGMTWDSMQWNPRNKNVFGNAQTLSTLSRS